MTILYFIIALGILVLVHEWGHFIVARRSGIRVEKFSIGFGPQIFSYKGKETQYRVALLPLGGYVKLYGEDPAAEADGDAEKMQEIVSSPDAFSSKSLGKRLATVFAGPAMNLVLAFLVMPLVFFIGRMTPQILEAPPVILGVQENSPASGAGLQKGDKIVDIQSRPMSNWSDVLNFVVLHPGEDTRITIDRSGEKMDLPLKILTPPDSKERIGYVGFEPQYFWGNDPIVGDVSSSGAAGQAGLTKGDVITSVNGKAVTLWTELTTLIRGSNGSPLEVTFQRGAEKKTATLNPTFSDATGSYVIGISKYVDQTHFVKKRYGIAESIRLGIKETVKLLEMTFDVLKRLFSLQLSYKTLGGPLQIAQATGQAARAGLSEFLYFLCFMSLQLGVLNLLPIPVLDGGHVLFMAIEGVRRKPVSLKVRNAFTQIGFIFLITLMIVITFNDVDRLWGLSKLWEKVAGIF